MNYFIYNPIAGNSPSKKRAALVRLIKLDPTNIILETENKSEETKLALKAIELGAKKVIAIGGDGTINKVALALAGTKIPLGIIPIGSGNGLARHLGIPMNPKIALYKALKGKINQIDACQIGDKMFFCTAGIGFDAAVAQIFNKRGKRGLFNYIVSLFIALRTYEPIEIEIEPGKKEKIFLLTIANANQYGNNAFISPFADIQDGKFEIIKIKNNSLFSLLPLSLRLFLKTLHKSKGVEIISARDISIKYKINQPLQIDGESLETSEEVLNVSIRKDALTVIV
jgi:YegS/Rv2252/BmrU family lipid kinase